MKNDNSADFDEQTEFNSDPKDENDMENSNDDLNSRINRLYGLEEPKNYEEKKVINYNSEELLATRKKLLILLFILLAFAFIFIIFLFNPLSHSSNGKSSSDNEEKDTNDDEQNTVDELPLGEVQLSNNIVLGLNAFATFSIADFYYQDFYSLFNQPSLLSSQMSDNLKVYFISKDNTFSEYLNELGVTEYVKSCNGVGLTLDNNKMNSFIAKTLGSNTQLADGAYKYLYTNNDLAKYVILIITKNGDNYKLTCSNEQLNTNVNKYLQQKLVKAMKTETGIEIYQSVVFINETGVYKEPGFKTLITNDVNVKFDDYINKGSMYRFSFTIEDNGNYYLSKIELVEEDG